MKQNRRTQLYIDRNVQGTLLLRVAMYWVFCVFSVTLMIVCWNAFSGPPRGFFELFREIYPRYAPALGAALMLLPIVMMDALRLSSRFVGPVFRLRAAMKELADGQQTLPLAFRDNDFWREMAEDFNRVAARMPHNMLGRPTEAMPPSLAGIHADEDAELARS
jgi:hypothetical protein